MVMIFSSNPRRTLSPRSDDDEGPAAADVPVRQDMRPPADGGAVRNAWQKLPAMATGARFASAVAVTGLLLLMASVAQATAADQDALAELGRLLFFDKNLSARRSQSCATCHDPERAFTDPRDNAANGAASLGDDGYSLGTRNTPSTAYVSLNPAFGRGADGLYAGGFFHDGRARDLATQAVEPVLNPLEMAMPDASSVSARLRENPVYVERFGAPVLNDPVQTLAAVGAALAAFQRTAFFAPFDSRYDRYLRGEYTLTADEDIGRRLFFATLTNCASCHVLNTLAPTAAEPFTNFQYHNIGVPANAELLVANGRGPRYVDRGLAENPAAAGRDAAGRFKVPTLRNVAVTAPYMHNGVFRDLRTALHFYNRHIVNSAASRTNPETGSPWGPAEVPDNLATDLLRQGQPLDDERITMLIAFLRLLTDKRYEPLQDAMPALPGHEP